MSAESNGCANGSARQRCSMKPESADDNQLKQLYTEQRHSDRQAAPSFGATLQAARARGESVRAFPVALRLAAGASMMVLAGISANLYLQHPNTPTLEHSASSSPVVLITQWQSPTEFLLNPTTATDDTTSSP